MIQVAEDIMLEITNSRGGIVRETITPGKWEKKKTINNLKCLIVNYLFWSTINQWRTWIGLLKLLWIVIEVHSEQGY